ncbi:hypothetical protein GCM10023224_05420 [Streptomonospora halophila]|uniref:Uncharacterized protein n=1 Tax=Streptomonospora halophila TaxID=427369 RepID=A0ABP9G8Y6_9ACTN
MPRITDYAPWPDQNTPDIAHQLAKAFTAQTLWSTGAQQAHIGAVDGQFMTHTRIACSSYVAARLLRALTQHAPEVADEVAREIAAGLADGQTVQLDPAQWAHEYGLDSEQVAAAGETANRIRTQEADA